MACLDSDLLIAVLRGNDDARAYIEGVLPKSENLCTTIFNEYEVWAGAFIRGEKRAEDAWRLLSGIRIFQANTNSARTFGKLSAAMIKKGTQLPEMDLMIASIVLENNETIVTRNEKHFSKVPGLKVIKW